MARTQTRNFGAREQRRTECEVRNAEWRALTPTEQIKWLDQRLGAGIGAVKQRAKIARKLTLPNAENKVTEVFASKSEEKRIKVQRKGKK